jgi:hypothetical protein
MTRGDLAEWGLARAVRATRISENLLDLAVRNIANLHGSTEYRGARGWLEGIAESGPDQFVLYWVRAEFARLAKRRAP